MTECVLDASAILALLLSEPGSDAVAERIEGSLASAVNISEVLAKLLERGIETEAAWSQIGPLMQTIVPFDAEQARLTAELRPATRSLGLSLGDRACLALAKQHKCPVLTTDRQWKKLKLDIQIVVVR